MVNVHLPMCLDQTLKDHIISLPLLLAVDIKINGVMLLLTPTILQLLLDSGAKILEGKLINGKATIRIS
ncbi:hypothetical protein, partial [Salmonella sp. s51228]|uniref:hypothetical protein n=1 Tax=Salmonella sp. s51228 TaxID=3159652 RepID=UPI00397EED16